MNDTPIVLNASVPMPRGQGGIDVNLGTMQSTSRNWLSIEELRVFIDPGENAALAGADPFNNINTDLGYMVDVSISAGHMEMTTGFIGTDAHPTGEWIQYVPAFLLGPRIYRRFTTVQNNQAVLGGGRRADQNAYTWRLPRPMLVPPNTPVKFKVRRTSSNTFLDNPEKYPAPFQVEVAAVGLKLAKAPKTRRAVVSHLQGWSPRNANLGRVESGEAFRNQFKEVAHLTRLVGGIATDYGASVGTNAFVAGPTGQGGQANVQIDPSYLFLYDANGQDVLTPNPLIPIQKGPIAQIPFSRLFLEKMNSVRFHDRVAMGQVYRAIVSPVIAAPNEGEILSLPMLGLESYREVSV